MRTTVLDCYFEGESKDLLVDFLLSKGYNDFYFFDCSRYGAGSFLVSLKEQVTARAKWGLFRLFLAEEDPTALVEGIKKVIPQGAVKIFLHEADER
ncbi:MAG: DUF3240 family protein [Sulfuricurvum sp.]|jgi:hypothetical protein